MYALRIHHNNINNGIKNPIVFHRDGQEIFRRCNVPIQLGGGAKEKNNSLLDEELYTHQGEEEARFFLPAIGFLMILCGAPLALFAFMMLTIAPLVFAFMHDDPKTMEYPGNVWAILSNDTISGRFDRNDIVCLASVLPVASLDRFPVFSLSRLSSSAPSVFRVIQSCNHSPDQ